MRCLNVFRVVDHARHKKAWKRVVSGGVWSGGHDVMFDPFGLTGGLVAKAFDPFGIEGKASKSLMDTFDPPKVQGGEEVAALEPLAPQEETNVEDAAFAAADLAKKRRGRGAAGTVLTSPLGVTRSGNITRKTLLGA